MALLGKTVLNGKIQEAENLQEGDYTSCSWKSYQDALTEAKQVNTDTTASQAKVNNAAQSLDTAKLVSIKNLKAAVDRLERELADKEGNKADYTNWDEAERVLANAKIILNRANATKTQVEDAERSLEITLIAKEEAPKQADKTALNQAIANAKTKKSADYKSAGYKSMQAKLTSAQAVADNPNATQTEVDNAKNELVDAVNKLVRTVKVKTIKCAAKSYKIAAGKTISVKAAAADGSGKTAAIKIKIMKKAVTKITVKKKSFTVKAGKKVTLQTAVRPNDKNVNKALSYTSSNEKLATVKNGVVKTKKGKKGKVTITIRSTDSRNKSVEVKITIK